jgi:hypothetical protein
MTTRLAILSILRDESPYLEEWMRWHAAVGVERFYLYINEGSDVTETMEIAGRMAYELDVGVSTDLWHGEQQQYLAYADGLKQATAHGVEWLAVIDLDEFLQPAVGTTVLTHLPDDATCVEARWAMYGTSHKDYADLTQPVVGRFTFRMSEPHPLCKSIVRPEAFRGFVESHHFKVEGKTVEAKFDALRINHYWTKSREECAARFKRGRVDIPEARQWREFTETEALFNERRDLTAWHWLAAAGYESTIEQSAAGPIDFQWHLRHDDPDVH